MSISECIEAGCDDLCNSVSGLCNFHDNHERKRINAIKHRAANDYELPYINIRGGDHDNKQ